MTIKYKRVETNSVENVALVERLVANGWKITRSNIFAVMLEKKVADKAIRRTAEVKEKWKRDYFGQLTYGVGDRVREIDGRHVGTVRAVLWSHTARVVWDDTGYLSDLEMTDLEGAHHDDD